MPSNSKFSYIHHEIVPVENAFLHVRDLSIQRGYGIFDFFKIHDGHPYFLDDYLDRFYNSAAIMHLTVPHTREELKSVIYTLIEKNDIAESGIKMILTGGYSEDGYQPAEPNLIITQHSLTLPGEDQIKNGVKIITHEYGRDLASAKTINYSIGIWLINKVKESKAMDVLYHQHGIVSEFPRCNLFIVRKDNTIVTPAHHVLHGITRKNILKLAAKRYRAEEAIVTLDDICQAKEAFLTSTTKRIVPIVQINETQIGNGKPGEVSLSLLKDLIALEDADYKAKVF
ncbi:aminotransferase class IV [Ohtaekwangia koreensis]|uniref:branched-chain-amino-acid transaminase n=1 Tax=Ohtaekwangia koreensis TaxID=688867 RepID=A0A1T5M2X8_9BACT|nr:aminotransferase class IV [Ohtaekwangia koreensis]SKC82374.1 branched-chain amino acid aminotransferase [Ohtaekwangia koreensis]